MKKNQKYYVKIDAFILHVKVQACPIIQTVYPTQDGFRLDKTGKWVNNMNY